ncbi:type IV pili methyl-accepting chemotaxis transducer N-terminal domain-containing protein [Aliiruegeria sabulilitoris]|uniref:type IV pili methyl-accepting chemotaxis transducer N-terminal domain-containing protein n=1 Tax=Aliiruegeria sabulilitoris TaxID=1510458 RepID=UPI00082DA7EA|nr:type IV pili methyl-accepting chemotaxis transducer N-terminal domain-containing protein [Aliiruegeria sabulilitoris]NDR55158.1 hypothetical protein [Pseudoruegeria sp. M32A2M]
MKILRADLYRGERSVAVRFRENRRWLVLFGMAAFGGALAAPVQAISKDILPDVGRRLTISGRQRMLIQRSGKLVCLSHHNPDAHRLLMAARESIELHQRSQAALREGDIDLGLVPENNSQILQELDRAEQLFNPFGAAVLDAVERRTVAAENLEAIAKLNGPALVAMDRAVAAIERVYRNQDLSEQRAMLINIAVRQGMLSQRLMLQLCLNRFNPADEDVFDDLFLAMNRFTVSLNILRRVSPQSVPPGAREKLVNTLEGADELWKELRIESSRATRRISGLSGSDMLEIDQRFEELLKKSNDVALLLEGAAK